VVSLLRWGLGVGGERCCVGGVFFVVVWVAGWVRCVWMRRPWLGIGARFGPDVDAGRSGFLRGCVVGGFVAGVGWGRVVFACVCGGRVRGATSSVRWGGGAV